MWTICFLTERIDHLLSYAGLVSYRVHAGNMYEGGRSAGWVGTAYSCLCVAWKLSQLEGKTLAEV